MARINNYKKLHTRVSGTSGRDTIYNLSGSDYVTIDAGNGNDYIYISKDGNNTTINSGAGDDTIKNHSLASCGAVHLTKSEDSDLRIFNNEPDVAKSPNLETGFEPQKSE